MTLACELCHAIKSCQKLPTSSQSMITFGETDERGALENALHWNRMRQTKATSRTQKFSEFAIAQVVRCWTRVVREHLLVRVLSSAMWKFRGLDDSTQHPQGAVELEWDVGDTVIRFVAHVVLGNSGLLLSRCDLEALGATIDLRNDQMHLENPRTTLKLSVTPAGHFEVDLLNMTRDAAEMDSLDESLGSTVKVSMKDGSTSPFFF